MTLYPASYGWRAEAENDAEREALILALDLVFDGRRDPLWVRTWKSREGIEVASLSPSFKHIFLKDAAATRLGLEPAKPAS